MKNWILIAWLFGTLSLTAQPLQEYYFNNSLAGTGGAGTLTELLSCGATTGTYGTDSILTANGLCSVSTDFCFNAGGGFSYPNTTITGSYSINLFFKFNTLSGYSRIIDFSNSANDAGFYLLNNCLNFYPNGNVGTCPYFQPNVYYLFTFVRNGATNVISVYVNGTLFSTYNDATNLYSPATASTPIVFFRDDNAVPCESKAGCIKYASVSSQQLSAMQVDSIWQNICSISLPPCTASISYAGSPYSNTLSAPQPVSLSGDTGGVFTAPSGLSINPATGAINPSASTPGTYTVTYTVAQSGLCSGFITTASVTITGSGFCSAAGNTLIFSNYDGGYLNINVDVNIPNLKIGIVTYEPVIITLSGPYAANVAKVLRAGFPNTNNDNCNLGVFTTVINGPVPANYSIVNIPPVGLSNPNGYASGIICAYSCNTTSNQGGCNTIDQVLDYFNTSLGGNLYALNVQYCCWQNSSIYSVSAMAGSCCNASSPSATIAYPGTPYCQSVSTPQTVSLSGSTGGTYSAAPAGLSINTATGTINPAASSIGTYTVTYTVPGCPSFTTTATVEIATGPTASLSYPAASFCSAAPDQNVTLTGTGGGVFSAPAGLSINAATGTISPSASSTGSYTVTYTLTQSGGCAAFSTTAQVDIVASVQQTISAQICQGQTYPFGNLLADTTGTYSDTSTNQAGCDSITRLNLTVSALPQVTVTADTTIFCPGDSTQLCASGSAGTYLWNTGASMACTYVQNAGNYYVTLTDANNCTAQSIPVAVSVHPLPPVSVSINGDTLVAFNAVSYQWYLNGNPIPGAQNSFYGAIASGSYQVEVTDSNGCKALSSVFQVNVTGLEERVEEEFRIYPNPAQGAEWNIECGPSWIGSRLELSEAGGRIVYKGGILSSRHTIRMQTAPGIYYLRIYSGTKTLVRKLIHL